MHASHVVNPDMSIKDIEVPVYMEKTCFGREGHSHSERLYEKKG